LAGLVNFISHEPADFLEGDAGVARTLGGRVWLGYSGDDNERGAGATLAGRFSEQAEWLLTAAANQAGALENMGSNEAANVDRTTPNPQQSGGTSLLGKVVWRAGDGQRHVLTLSMSARTEVELLSSRAKPPTPHAGTTSGAGRGRRRGQDDGAQPPHLMDAFPFKPAG
jgi:hemoglobin/transferrin/lactoferrin receptor protein